MKKLLLIFCLSLGVWHGAFAQTPQEPVQQTLFSTVDIDSLQATPVVIIDDDELGVTISPNPANTYINVHGNSEQNLNSKTFTIVNFVGVVVLQQGLSSSTVVLTGLACGTYTWAITNAQNKKLAEGILIIQ